MDQGLQGVRKWIQEELDRCISFWLENGQDQQHGGVLTCLDRTGQVYSTDKSVWMQGRCAWTFSKLCNQYGENPRWKGFAESCLDFLENHCINRELENRMYFQVTREGKPLRQRRYNFSEGFYAMANAEYYMLTGDEVRLMRARDAYEAIWNLNQGLKGDPVGYPAKVDDTTRPMRGLANPMIYLNLTNVLRKADPDRKALYNQRAETCVREILDLHRKKDMACTLETVGPNGEFYDQVSMGRVVNPGHDIECAWFLMEEANNRRDKALHEEAQSMFMDAITAGWDHEYGGLLYFMDCLGKPPEAYEHDMKLWWPHNETMIAALMAYRDTGKEAFLDWFMKTLEYVKEFFSDPEYGEWYGYLRRDGKPTQPACKGSTFKGPFHLPRMLLMLDEILGQMDE